jgi:hypothetical protein
MINILKPLTVVIIFLSQCSLDIYPESLLIHYRHLITDPFLEIPKQNIEWKNPKLLLRHEYTSRPHLESLISHLSTIDMATAVPLPVITSTAPHVILDGHHRVAASRILGLKKIPVWVIDESEEIRDYNSSFVRCYSRTDGTRMALKDLIYGARKGRIEWGIKGTRHVAIIGKKDKMEVELERVTPRLSWKEWQMGEPIENTLNTSSDTKL